MSVRVSPKFQVVIPVEARRALNIKPGMEVEVIVKGGIAYLVPLKSLAELEKNIQPGWTVRDRRSVREK